LLKDNFLNPDVKTIFVSAIGVSQENFIKFKEIAPGETSVVISSLYQMACG